MELTPTRGMCVYVVTIELGNEALRFANAVSNVASVPDSEAIIACAEKLQVLVIVEVLLEFKILLE